MSIRLIAITALSFGLITSSCDRWNGDKKNPDQPAPSGEPSAPASPPTSSTPGESNSKGESNSFALAVTEDKWSASKYCGDVVPQIPEDPTPEYRFETHFINQQLASADGLKGWIHGAVPRYRQFVFTYRKEDPDDFMAFFKAQQFSLIPANEAVAAKLLELSRHDRVNLKGSILQNGSPLVHIKVTDLVVVKKYENALKSEYTFDDSILAGATNAEVFGLVHATAHSEELGWAVVIEKDKFLLPVAVDPAHAAVAAKLFRGDIINMSLSVVRRGQGPVHFMTNNAVADAIKVVDPMLNCHGVKREVVGTLAKFDKSPAISTDVYAVRYVDSNGLSRNMTFFPADGLSEDEFVEVFNAISAKAKAAWERSQEEAIIIRNFREKPSIRVVANGVLNVVSTEQANAQVYIRSADDVSFEVLR